MSEPRDLRLERFSDRDGQRLAQLDAIAHVGSPLAESSSAWTAEAAYEALIDAVFTAPGALEWLSGLRRTVAAVLGSKKSASHVPALNDAIRISPVAR